MLLTDDFPLEVGYCGVFGCLVYEAISPNSQNSLVSLQIFGPFIIWSGTVVMSVANWGLKMCFPGAHARIMEDRRVQKEAAERKKREGERSEEVEEGGVLEAQEEASEETPLTLGVR
jgi:hypothetical protein